MYKIIFHKEVTKDLKSTLIALIKVIKITIDERLSIRPYDFKTLSRKNKGLYRLRNRNIQHIGR